MIWESLAHRRGVKFADDVMGGIQENPNFGLLEEAGVYLAPVGKNIAKARPGAREESFISSYVSSIPGLNVSQRFHSLFLNKIRSDVFYKYAREWEGKNKVLQDYKDLAAFINNATGRGPLGPLAKAPELADLMNVFFFAPRFMTSRPAFLAGGAAVAARGHNPQVSKIWAKNLVAFAGTGGTMLWLASQHPNIDVEWNPKSSDFAKLKITDPKASPASTRIDIWGGFQPIVRYAAQVATRRRKPLSGGPEQEIAVTPTIMRFLQAKLNPITAFGRDVVQGEDFLGEEVRGGFEGVGDQLMKRVVPMAIQDIIDAAQKASPLGRGLSPLAFIGQGVQTFEDIQGMRNHISIRDLPGDLLYDERTIEERSEIDRHPEMKAWREEREARRRPQIPNAEELRRQMGDYRRRVDELTADLRAKIDAGASGRTLRGYVRDYLSERHSAYASNISPALDEFKARRLTEIEDIFRERYWGVDVPEDLKTGIFDFDAAEQEKLKIMEEWLALNPENRPESLLFRSPIDDPVVEGTISRYRAEHEQYRWWFTMPEDAAQFAGLGKEYTEWKVSKFSDATLALYPRLAQVLREVSQAKGQMREQWGPELERFLVRWPIRRQGNAVVDTPRLML